MTFIIQDKAAFVTSFMHQHLHTGTVNSIKLSDVNITQPKQK